ncbi:YdcF family protein [Sandaracinus amylolyticus]|uniref:YdcF family protein n=1 Tax=Sandaracinus amylolyticus TaxID=927083 RepID=UPI0012ECC5D9|nr:YdcF family protein [Sandaracinus amylolyticus]
MPRRVMPARVSAPPEPSLRVVIVQRALPAASAGALAFVVADRLGLVTLLGLRRLLDLEDAWLVFAFAIVSGAIAATRARALPWIAFAALGVLYVLVAFTPLFDAQYDAWLLRDAPRAADAIVVLSSDVTSEGRLSSNGLSRLVAGLALARDGHAPLLVRTDLGAGHADDTGDALEIAEGTSVEVVRVGPVASTRDEALRVDELAAARPLRRVIVVTDAMHERRAAATFRAMGLEVIAVPAPERDFSLPPRDPDDRVRAFEEWITERAAWTLYAMRGWIDEGDQAR